MNNDDKNILSKLSYSIDKNGEIYVDISIEDYSEEALKKLATLLASISTPNFELQTLSIANEAFNKDEKDEEFNFLVTHMLEKKDIFNNLQIKDFYKEDEGDGENDPLIKPTDLT
jgi:hypothetical protein